MQHQQTQQLANAGIGQLLLKFSIPAVVGTMVNSLYNVVDRIFIGQGVGADGLAAATVSFPIMMMTMAFGMLIGYGTNAIISLRLGEQDHEGAEQAFGQALMLFFLFAIVFTTLGLIFLSPLLRVFGASDTILPLAREYMSIILIGVFMFEMSFGANSFIRGEGNPRVAMVTMIIGATINTILDPIFIFGLDMGMRGAALATVIAQSCSALWVLRYFLSGRSVLNIHRHNLAIKPALVRRVVQVGSPPFVMHIANIFILAIVNNTLKAYGGDLAISALGVIFTLNMMLFMPIIGTSQGAQPIFGYNYGAKHFDRVRNTLVQTIRIVTVFCVGGAIFIQLFANYLMVPFAGGNQALIDLGSFAMRHVLMFFPVIGFIVIVSNYFQATGRPGTALLLSLMRQVIMLIPLFLILPRFFGLNGVWYSYPITDTATFALALIIFIRELRRLKKIKHYTEK